MTVQLPKFEDTKLVNHPEVKRAYEYLVDAHKAGDPVAEMAVENGLAAAKILSAYSSNKDPNAIAAAILLPFIVNDDTGGQVVDTMQPNFDALTLEYAGSMQFMMHPMGVEDFPSFPISHRRAAVSIFVAGSIAQLQELEQMVGSLDRAQIRDMLQNDTDPVMPSFEQYVAIGTLRKSDPGLMKAHDDLRQSLLDIADGKTSKPSAANSPKP